RITPQRLAIIDFLQGNKNHPSALTIFQHIKKQYPTISLATVYKTLKVLVDIGQIQSLTISEDKNVFDPITKNHAHFHCRQCHRIFDIRLEQKLAGKEIDGHLVEDYQAYFYGICRTCRSWPS
ncbi:MAG: Fur family transcriptional regulator, partial [Candidatus Aminicenantales bacterium]